MNWLITDNNKKINALDIPTVSIGEIRQDFGNLNKRLIGFFGKQEFNNVRLYVILSDDKVGKIYITSSLFTQDQKSYESFTQNFSVFHNFEREFYEECLGAKGRERLIKYTDKGIESYIGIARNQFDESRSLLKSHSLRDTALELKKNLIRQAEASKAISVAEKTLAYHKDKLATAQEKLRQILTSKKEGKLIQQKLKERRQNG